MVEQPYVFSKIATRRRAFLAEHVAWSDKAALEIGAFDNATLSRADCAVSYLDWFTAAELKEKHKDNPKRRLDWCVEVDYVVKDPRLSSFVNSTFDIVIANHVIEHVPDLIGWLAELHTITRPGAIVFLSVPDKRFTFDINRECTDAVELVRRSWEGLERPTIYDHIRSEFYFQSVDAAAAWDGDIPAAAGRRRSFVSAITRARVLAKVYTDAHCHIFTAETFGLVMKDLMEGNFISWRLDAVSGPEKGSNEFHVLLGRMET